MNQKKHIVKSIVRTISYCAGLLTLLPSISSCGDKKNEGRDDNYQMNKGSYEYKGGLWGSMDYRIEERVVDSCEYIVIFGSEGRNLIHKANCENPFHKQ